MERRQSERRHSAGIRYCRLLAGKDERRHLAGIDIRRHSAGSPSLNWQFDQFGIIHSTNTIRSSLETT